MELVRNVKSSLDPIQWEEFVFKVLVQMLNILMIRATVNNVDLAQDPVLTTKDRNVSLTIVELPKFS
jgi:hypothetical protein